MIEAPECVIRLLRSPSILSFLEGHLNRKEVAFQINNEVDILLESPEMSNEDRNLYLAAFEKSRNKCSDNFGEVLWIPAGRFRNYFLDGRYTIKYLVNRQILLFIAGYRGLNTLEKLAKEWAEWDSKRKRLEYKLNIQGWSELARPDQQKSIEQLLRGHWYCYLRDGIGVLKTSLEIRQKPDGLRAYYSSYQRDTLEGDVVHAHQQLFITLTDKLESYRATLTAFANKVLLEEHSEFICGINSVTVNGATLGLPIVLSKRSGDYGLLENEISAHYIYKEPVWVEGQRAQEETSEAELPPLSALDLKIARFLGSQSSISTPAYEQKQSYSIESWNREILDSRQRGHYGSLKRTLAGHNWVSVSRAHDEDNDELTVYYWQFHFDDVIMKCSVNRTSKIRSGDPTYYGEVRVENERIWLDLRNHKGRPKHIYGKNEGSEREPVFLLFASNRHKQRDMVVREILMPTNELGFQEIIEGKRPKKIGYEQLLQTVDPKNGDSIKIHLNYARHSVLSYPKGLGTKTRYGRQRRASRFAGQYFVYFLNAYETDSKYLGRFTVTIDGLSGVRLEKRYTKGFLERVKRKSSVIEFDYEGYAEAMNQSLFLFLEHKAGDDEKRQDARFLFHTNNTDVEPMGENESVLAGLLVDTDIFSYPDSAACLAIRLDSFEKYVPEFKPRFRVKSNKELGELNRIFKGFESPLKDNNSDSETSVIEFLEKTSSSGGLLTLHDLYKRPR